MAKEQLNILDSAVREMNDKKKTMTLRDFRNAVSVFQTTNLALKANRDKLKGLSMDEWSLQQADDKLKEDFESHDHPTPAIQELIDINKEVENNFEYNLGTS